MRDRTYLDVERTAKGFNVYTDRKRILEKHLFMRRLPPVLALLRRPDCIPTKTTVCIGDGVTAQETAQEPMIAFCAARERSVVLIPDYTFLESHGYETLHRWSALNWQEWNSRSDTILWRGATHPRRGSGRISSAEMSPDNLMPRVQLCLLAKGISGNRDRGEPRGSAPPTPPCIRVRTRRFGWMSVHRVSNLGSPSESK